MEVRSIPFPFGAKHRAGCDARRDEQRRDTREPLEVEIELASRLSGGIAFQGGGT